jgi:hypothetical protein
VEFIEEAKSNRSGRNFFENDGMDSEKAILGGKVC